MKTLIIYYSYSGHTRKIAETIASSESADIAEIKDVKRPGKFKAYTAGCFAAIRGKAWNIEPLNADFAEYDRLILLSPVWASSMTPAMTAFLKQLPEGKTVAVKMVSMSGNSVCKERIETAIKAKGGTLESFEDIKVKV